MGQCGGDKVMWANSDYNIHVNCLLLYKVVVLVIVAVVVAVVEVEVEVVVVVVEHAPNM